MMTVLLFLPPTVWVLLRGVPSIAVQRRVQVPVGFLSIVLALLPGFKYFKSSVLNFSLIVKAESTLFAGIFRMFRARSQSCCLLVMLLPKSQMWSSSNVTSAGEMHSYWILKIIEENNAASYDKVENKICRSMDTSSSFTLIDCYDYIKINSKDKDD